jgi:hypothetical protein
LIGRIRTLVQTSLLSKLRVSPAKHSKQGRRNDAGLDM